MKHGETSDHNRPKASENLAIKSGCLGFQHVSTKASSLERTQRRAGPDLLSDTRRFRFSSTPIPPTVLASDERDTFCR